MPTSIVQSHRGGGALTPENTLESFHATWKMGALPEADLHTTSDGVIVAFHDANFARVVKDIAPELREKGVQDVTWDELSRLDVGAWQGEEFAGQRVCRVEDIFAALRENHKSGLYLDIKNVHLPQLADLARQIEVEKRVILASPREQTLREWIGLIPQGQTLLWMGIRNTGDEAALRNRLAELGTEDFVGLTQLQIHVEATPNGEGWSFKPSLGFMREVAAQLRDHGVLFQSLPWNCAEDAVYRALLEAGVASFASDYPEVALRVLREWHQKGN